MTALGHRRGARRSRPQEPPLAAGDLPDHHNRVPATPFGTNVEHLVPGHGTDRCGTVRDPSQSLLGGIDTTVPQHLGQDDEPGGREER